MLSTVLLSSVLLGIAKSAVAAPLPGAGAFAGIGAEKFFAGSDAASRSGVPLLRTEDLEEPPYTVVAQHEGFEERLYPARRWATAAREGQEGDATRQHWTVLFGRLFGYISGTNDREVIIPMTAPVTTQVLPSASGAPAATFAMSFYVPEDHQAAAPAGQGITIEDRPEMTVFTRRFGGYTTDEIVAKEAKELAELVAASSVGADVDLSTYYVAGYDDPRKVEGRRNEVWFYRTTPKPSPAEA